MFEEIFDFDRFLPDIDLEDSDLTIILPVTAFVLVILVFDDEIPSLITEVEVEDKRQGTALEEVEKEEEEFADTEVEVEVRIGIGNPFGWPSPNPMIWLVEDRGEPISG